MKTIGALAILTMVLANLKGYTQVSPGYMENVTKGAELYQKKEFAASAKAYSVAFALNNGKGTETDRYNAACSYALAGNTDSAFVYLLGAAERNKYSNYNHMIADTDLESLHRDKRWTAILTLVKQNKEKVEENYLKPVVAILDSVLEEDQKWRAGIMQLIQKEGMESAVVKERLQKMQYADSVNLLKIQKILDQYGWVGFDQVGRTGAMTIFLVIQHSSLPVQQKYLPMMREAVAKKQAVAGNLALLEDRVAISEGRKQVYGSQLQTDKVTGKNFLSPLEDPDHVDERRAAVGLGPLAEYLKQFDVEWDAEAFKKQQQANEKRGKQ